MPSVYLGGGALSGILSGLSAYHTYQLVLNPPAKEEESEEKSSETNPSQVPRTATPLHLAAMTETVPVTRIRELLEAQANCEVEDDQGHTPVFYAAKNCDAKKTELLLQRCKELLPSAWEGWLERGNQPEQQALETAGLLCLLHQDREDERSLPSTIKEAEPTIRSLYEKHKTSTEWEALMHYVEIVKDDWIERVKQADPKQEGPFLEFAIFSRCPEKIAQLLDLGYPVTASLLKDASHPVLTLPQETILALGAKVSKN
ncbi:MAG: hypothetical protein JSR80_02480 [Verrucomicrobia bacterium]|nr:hypothetical protein [Verrucomicrobiota bacterium]